MPLFHFATFLFSASGTLPLSPSCLYRFCNGCQFALLGEYPFSAACEVSYTCVGTSAAAGHTADFPEEASSLMVVASGDDSWSKDKAKAPVHYGGITKQCWRVKMEGDTFLDEVTYFC